MIPPEPTPPDTIGTNPRNAAEVNGIIGTHLRDFLKMKTVINQDAEWLSVADLKVAPYHFTQDQEDDLKSAVNSVDTPLDGIDLTFVNRVVGPG